MKKKCIKSIISLGLALCLSGISIPAYANQLNNSDNVKIATIQQPKNYDENFITETNAKIIVKSYIKANKDLWNQNTKVSKTTILYDNTDKITGYCFELSNLETYCGYIVASADLRQDLIKEFSQKARPLFESINNNHEKVYYTNTLEYYSKSRQKILDLNNKDISIDKIKNKFIYDEKIKKENEYMLNVNQNWNTSLSNGSIITQGYSYDDPSGPYSDSDYVGGNSLSNFTNILQDDLEDGASNCTLTSVTEILYYYRTRWSYASIPYDDYVYTTMPLDLQLATMDIHIVAALILGITVNCLKILLHTMVIQCQVIVHS